MLKHVKIVGTAGYLPGEPVPYDDAYKYLGVIKGLPTEVQDRIERMEPVLRSILGMDYYHYAIDPETRKPTETVSSMASKAGKKALDEAGMHPSEVEFLAFGAPTFDHLISPPTSTMVQEQLEIPACGEVSLHSNCTASYKAFQIAYDMLRLGRYKTALVTSSCMTSAFFRAEYYNPQKTTRDQALLRRFLCDGGGAIALRATDEVEDGLYVGDVWMESKGTEHRPHMYTEFMGNDLELLKAYENGTHHLSQDFQAVVKVGTPFFMEGCQKMVDLFKLRPEEITYFLANVPNRLLLDKAVELGKEMFGFDASTFYSSLQRRGYAGPPAILITLDDLLKEKGTRKGDVIASAVTESSKWINGGFYIRHC